MKKLLGVIAVLFGLFSLGSCSNQSKLKQAMTYEQFMEAEAGDEVTIEGFIAAKQSWWNDQVTLYLLTETSGEGYFVYNMACTEDENNNVYKIGTYVHIEASAKTVFAGEHEIMGDDITKVEVIDAGDKTMNTTPIDVSNKLTSLEQYQNSYFKATLTVVEYETTDQNVVVDSSNAFGYKGSTPTDDLYFTISDGTTELACCVEAYLTGSETAVHQTVQTLSVGDEVTVEGYLYWWNGANPHITSIVIK